MNRNVIDNLIATAIVIWLTLVLGFGLRLFGFSDQLSATISLLVALTIVIVGSRFYPDLLKRIFLKRLGDILQVQADDPNASKVSLKQEVLNLASPHLLALQTAASIRVREFSNQEACELLICDAFSAARSTKILTIRGGKYFLGPRSLFHDLCESKRPTGHRIKVLVLSPAATHINDQLATDIGHRSAQEIRAQIQNSIINLSLMSQSNPNMTIKCYNEKPNFKILIFDDIMFVSAFVGRKNDRNAKMYQMQRSDNPLFEGLERYFDDQWNRGSACPPP